jgi:esterase/lipase
LILASLAEPEVNGRIDDHPVKIDTPVFILAGRGDHQSEASVAYHFYEQVQAPKKAFVWFERSGHNPMFEEPRAFTDWMEANIAPLGERASPGR